MAQPRTVLILALDTTTRGGSIAVVNERELLALVPGDETRTHGERLPGEIALALDRAGVARTAIDLLAVATGPGAFTGLRIGLAAMQGLAMALDRPVAGISALDALVHEAGAPAVEFIAPWMDAQRGDVFASLTTHDLASSHDVPSGGDVAFGFLTAEASAKAVSRTLIEPIAGNPRALLEQWREQLRGHATLFTGDAVARDRALIAEIGDGQWTVRQPGPLAAAIAELGLMRARAGLAGPPHALTPIYVRRPDAEIERDRRSGA